MQFLSKNAILRNKVTLFLCCCLALASCEDPNELGVGLVDDNISGKYTDTLTVNVSTVYLDSLATSGQGTLLVGEFTAPYSGEVDVNAVFPVSLGGTWTLAEDAAYDSLKLILPLGGYYYGDTTQAQTLEVYRLNSDIKTTKLGPYFFNEQPASFFYADNAIYNISTVATATDPLGAVTFRPRPVAKDTLAVPLSDELGQELISLRKAADSRLTDGTNFLNYFKGLQLTSNGGSAVVGFPVGGVKVRLYYSETVNGAKAGKTKDFTITNTGLQFNQITTNLEGTALEGLERGGEAVPSAQTGNVSVTQTGAGLVIKLEFPYLNDLKTQLTPELINRAVLIVEPQNNTIQYPYPVPPALMLYNTNRTNVPLRPASFDPLVENSPSLGANYDKEKNRYEFNITPYIIQQLKTQNTAGNALLIAPPTVAATAQNPVPANLKDVSRLVVGGPQNVKLKIYYTTIK